MCAVAVNLKTARVIFCHGVPVSVWQGVVSVSQWRGESCRQLDAGSSQHSSLASKQSAHLLPILLEWTRETRKCAHGSFSLKRYREWVSRGKQLMWTHSVVFIKWQTAAVVCVNVCWGATDSPERLRENGFVLKYCIPHWVSSVEYHWVLRIPKIRVSWIYSDFICIRANRRAFFTANIFQL